MAKAKKKRTLKEIDKLWSKAKYWEWLRLVEQEGLVKSHPDQWQEAWRNLCRWALRLPDHLQEFWQRLAEVKTIPDFPDLVLIRRLQDFLENQDARPAIAALTGLSPAAQLFREKLLSWSWDAAQDKKIGRFFKILITQPEKVTGRTFTELGKLLAPNPLSETIQSLSKAITQARKFNSKIAADHRNRVGHADREFKLLDSRLQRLAESLDPVLRQAVLYPFIFQAVQLFDRLVAREDLAELAHWAVVIPFLFDQAAGTQAEYLRDRCWSLAGEVASEPEAIDYLKKAWSQDLETQVAALGKVRLALKSFEPSGRTLQEFYNFYIRVLDGIGVGQKKLTLREKIDLMQVMDPIIFNDLEWLLDDDPGDVFFLNKVIDSGCGGALICLLTLLKPTADRGLKRKAHANLQKLPYPGEKQISRVLAKLYEPIFPHVRLVRPLLELYPTEAGLRKLLFDSLFFDARMFLLTNAMAMKYETSAKVRKRLTPVLQDAVATLKIDLTDFNDYEEAIVLKDLFECFSEGYLTAEGYHSLFLKIYDRQKSFDYLFSQLDRYFLTWDMLSLDEIFSTLSGEWLDKQEELLFDFVSEHGDDLKTAPFDTIRQIVDRFCHPEFMYPKGLNFFLSLSNRVKERIEAGEFAAEDLQNRIMSLLLEYRQTRTRGRRTRK